MTNLYSRSSLKKLEKTRVLFVNSKFELSKKKFRLISQIQPQ